MANEYRDAVLNLNPRCFFRADGLGTSVLDSTGNEHHGPNIESGNRVAGPLNRAFQFNGVDEYTNLGTLGGFTADNNLAACAWSFFWRSTETAELYCCGNFNGDAWMMKVNEDNTSGRFQFRVKARNSSNGQYRIHVDLPNSMDGNWHHIVVSMSSPLSTGCVILYDGVEQSIQNIDTETSFNNTGSDNNPHYLGARHRDGGPQEYTDYSIAELSFFDDTLTLAEAEGLWDAYQAEVANANPPVTCKAKIAFGGYTGSSYRLVMSKASDYSNPIYFGAQSPDSYGSVVFTPNGLDLNTEYYYGIEEDGTFLTADRGSFTTLAENISDFSFMFASCHRLNGSYVTDIYDKIVQENPLFFFHTGDIHYADDPSTNPQDHVNNLETALTYQHAVDMFKSLPVYYIWDDHDYGPNNSNKDSPNRDASVQAFRSRVPVTPYQSGNLDAVYYSFEIGRVLFIVTDLRSEKDDDALTDDANKNMMSDTQKNWFNDLVSNNPDKAICWVCSLPWIGAQSTSEEHWGGYTNQREEIANIIADAGAQDRLFIISGDMHGIAVDDGTNSDYSTTGAGGFPVFHSAPIGNSNSVKGGPYSEGTFTSSNHQVSKIEVQDSGGSSINIVFRGYSYSGSGSLNQLITRTYTLNL